MELRRRVKHHQSNHLRLIRDSKMSKSSPTLSGSLKFQQKKKKKKKNRHRRDSEFYKPGTEVRVIRKGKYMFQTGTVVHRHYEVEETKKKKGPPLPPRTCSFTFFHTKTTHITHTIMLGPSDVKTIQKKKAPPPPSRPAHPTKQDLAVYVVCVTHFFGCENRVLLTHSTRINFTRPNTGTESERVR